MEKLSGTLASFRIATFTARTPGGFLGIARIVAHDDPHPWDSEGIERLRSGPHASEDEALRQAEAQARQRIWRRVLDALSCR